MIELLNFLLFALVLLEFEHLYLRGHLDLLALQLLELGFEFGEVRTSFLRKIRDNT